ncbi:RHS repeat domain-containing protein [Akkermansia sp.]|uniref:RHS repeat domain-containing protein n=1 Tax=Akkermansia sp. TaxID=1872421 RepID=UPI00399382C1
MKRGTYFLSLDADSSISLAIPFKNVELTSEAKDLSVKPESVVLEQGYYWCRIVHEYHPALGSGQEFCIAVLSDKAEAPDINSYLDPNVTPPDKEGEEVITLVNLYRDEEEETTSSSSSEGGGDDFEFDPKSSSSSSSSSSNSSSSSSGPEEEGCPCPCSCKCEEESAQSECDKNGGPNSAGGHSFGGNPNDPDDCEGMLEVGGENSGGGGEGGGATTFATFSFRANPQCSIGLRYKHPLEWTCSWDSASRQATVKRPTGSSISFRAAAGSADAPVSGGSRKLNYRVRLLNQDKSPCTDGNPIYLDMVQSNGSTLRFSASTGKVVSLISSSGVETTAEAYAAKLQVNRHPSTGAIQSIWSQSQGLLQAVPEGNKLTLEWYSPSQVNKTARSVTASGTPYKTVSYENTVKDGEPVMLITEQRQGMPAFRTERKVEGNNVTITQGEGDERIVRRIERNFLPGSKWEMIESYRKINEETPVSCVRTVQKSTDGGWLTISSTEGYDTPLAQTTLYTYNDQFRVSLEIKPDGGYTRYEYDDQGRVVLEATPWAGGGEKGTRTTYADLRFNDFRPATEREIIIAQDGTETVLNQRSYTYEDSHEVNRTTVTETALGSDEVHTSISETYGEATQYPYARGRQKMSQGINGVQTVYTYEATTDHGATHKVTSTVQANGSIVPGQSTRTVQYVAENGTTTRQEQYVHTGENWSLITSEDYEYDVELRRTKTTKGNGRIRTTEWMCCGPLRETDEDGITTSYAYNSAKQLVETIRSATETTPETITSYIYDAAGRIISTRKDVGALTTVESTEYDDLGRVISTTDILGRVTRTQYSDNQLTTTITNPSGATLITQTYYDGSILLQAGTGQREMETQLELTQEGILTTTLSRGVVLSRTLQNGFGQTIRQEQPNTLEGFIVTRNTYNDKGQLVRSQSEDMAPTMTVYNELGNVVRQTILLDELHPHDPTKNRISGSSLCYQIREDGVYEVQTTITYNAQGFPLTQIIEKIVSQLNSTLESKKITTDIYGQQSIQWTEYTAPTKRTQFSHIPTSDIIAKSLVVDGFTIRQTNCAGIHSSQERSYTSTGMMLKQTDARGNIMTIESDLAGRAVQTTDTAGNMTIITYTPCCDAPASITNALGDTARYSYDIRGRKIAEYGTAIQPSCFAYDEAGRLTSLTTFRTDEGDITTDPSSRTDGDTTRWLYDAATGLELKKTYANGSCVSKTYDRLNRLETLTKARGIVTTYQYAPATGELVSVSHSDNTQPWLYSYNHLGQMTSVYDASGTRELCYDAYGRTQQNNSFGTVESCIQEEYDAFGRPCGYRLMIGTRTVQYSHLDYGHQGAMIGMNMEGLDTPFTWQYDQISGFLNQLSYPNGMVRRNTYHPQLYLLASIGYEVPGNGGRVAGHVYQYDHLMRPVQRKDSWEAATPATTRDFTYNGRSELTGDQIQQRNNFAYQYDNIGNRKIARELEKEISYGANELNQYTNIIQADVSFDPLYDADGNQTRIRTSTGIWNVCYDGNDRPVSFTSEDGRTVVSCGYDYQGRRFEKKVLVNGTAASRTYYLYRGYLQVAELDLMHPQPVLVKDYVWDPTETIATRLLMMTCWKADGTETGGHLFFMHDALKNVTSIFDGQQARRARYEYAPFGALITAQGDMAQDNRFRFSCECMDDELGLVYYNYRHFNPADGRWINRDPIAEVGVWNLYKFVKNNGLNNIDILGLNEIIISGGCNTNTGGINQSSIYFDRFLSYLAFSAVQKVSGWGFHDQNWSNFIIAAEEQIKKRKGLLKPGEQIEWLVEYETYRIRAMNDMHGGQYYLDQIQKKAQELGVVLRFYKTKSDLASLINSVQVYVLDNATGTLTTAFMERTAQDKISRFVYYGHGEPGSLNPRYPFPTHGLPDNSFSITNNDIQQGIFKKGSFIKGAVVISCGCRTATPPGPGKPSFTQVWEGFFGTVMYGVDGRTSYAKPEKPVPSEQEKAHYVPSAPPL